MSPYSGRVNAAGEIEWPAQFANGDAFRRCEGMVTVDMGGGLFYALPPGVSLSPEAHAELVTAFGEEGPHAPEHTPPIHEEATIPVRNDRRGVRGGTNPTG